MDLFWAALISRSARHRQTDQRAFRNHGAVVGIVLNLAVWFALNALFPNHRALDWVALGLAIVAFVEMLRWKYEVIPVVFDATVPGFLYRTIT